MKSALTLAALLGAAACTRPNPAVCCLDQADCDEVGIGEVRNCADGLACVDHQCEVPSCAAAGCGAAAPVCNIVTDVCDPCTDSAECARFADTPVCEPSGGGCVQCLATSDCSGLPDTPVCDVMSSTCVECVVISDCSGTQPICDSNLCRGCRTDSECASSACGEDGACVAESGVVYLDPGGVDTGSCTRAAPCRRLLYGATQAGPTRQHVVMAPGGYVYPAFDITAQITTAALLIVHGNNASLSQSGETEFFFSSVPIHLRDLDTYGDGLSFSTTDTVVERVRVHAGYVGIRLDGMSTLRDVFVESTATGIYVTGGQFNGERIVVKQTPAFSLNALYVENGGSVNLTNVVLSGSGQYAIDALSVTGTISFATIVDSGSSTPGTTGPRAVRCSSGLTVRSSIIWAPGASARVPVEGCNLANTIAGPTPVPGTINMDPLFVNAAGGDYHLGANSPARDGVDMGPATDFEGDVRPQGARFDIGADESQ